MKTFVLLPLAALLITVSCSKQPMPVPTQNAASGTSIYSTQRLIGDTLVNPKNPFTNEPEKIPVKTPVKF